MNYLLLCVSVACASAKKVMSKAGKEEFSGIWRMYFLNFMSGLAAAAVIFITTPDFKFVINPYIIISAVLYAAFTLAAEIAFIKAVAIGSNAISTLIYSFGFLIPTVFGIVLYEKTVSPIAVLGIVLIIISLILSADLKSGEKGGKKWLFLSLSAMTCSGIIGIIQKVFVASRYKDDLYCFLFISFVIISVVSLAVAMTQKIKNKESCRKINVKFSIMSVTMGLCNGIANKLNLFLTGVMPSIVFFPTVNGGVIIIVAAVSAMLFSEKPNFKQIIGIIIGIIGIVTVGIFK